MEEIFTCQFRKASPYNSMASLHRHDMCELYFLSSGERRYFILDTVLTVHAKGFVFIKAGLFHKTSFSGSSQHTRYVANIPSSWLSGAEDVLPPFFAVDDVPFLEVLFSQLQMEADNTDEVASLRARGLAAQIVSQAYREWKERQQPHDPFIDEVTTYVKTNIAGDLTLDSLASHMGYSRNYFSSLFHEKTGMKLSDFIRSSRISMACKALERGEKVSSAASLAGFSDAGYFKDVFRSVMKISPSAYRKNAERSGKWVSCPVRTVPDEVSL